MDHHFHNPTEPLTEEFKVLRQAAYKRRHGQKRRAGDTCGDCSSSERCPEEDSDVALCAQDPLPDQMPCSRYCAYEDSAQSPRTPPNAKERALRRPGPAGRAAHDATAETGARRSPHLPAAHPCTPADNQTSGTPASRSMPVALSSPSAPDLWCSLTWASGLEFAPVRDQGWEAVAAGHVQTASS